MSLKQRHGDRYQVGDISWGTGKLISSQSWIVYWVLSLQFDIVDKV